MEEFTLIPAPPGYDEIKEDLSEVPVVAFRFYCWGKPLIPVSLDPCDDRPLRLPDGRIWFNGETYRNIADFHTIGFPKLGDHV